MPNLALLLLPPTLDELNAGLNLTLGLRPIRPMGMRPETVIAAEVPEHRVPLEPRAFEVPARDDRLQVVVDDLMRHPSQELEGLFVRSQEDRRLLVRRSPRSGRTDGPSSSSPRSSFSTGPSRPGPTDQEASRTASSLDRRLLSQRADEPPDNIIASPIALALDLLVDRSGAITDRRYSVSNPLLESRQKHAPLANPLVSPR